MCLVSIGDTLFVYKFGLKFGLPNIILSHTVTLLLHYWVLAPIAYITLWTSLSLIFLNPPLLQGHSYPKNQR